MTPEIAFVTIGQSGRPGIGNDVLAMLPAGVRVTVTGALDDLTTEDIAAARPEDGGDTLFTRLRDGTPVAVSRGWRHSPSEIIVMDCMGYTSADKARVRHGHDGPVILAASAVGRVMGELIE